MWGSLGNKGHWLLLIGTVIAFLACCYFGLRAILPINPVASYFPEKDRRLAGVRWLVGSFQPVYLYSFERGKMSFFKVVYRDAKNGIRFMDVAVGGEGVDIPMAGVVNPVDAEDPPIEVAKVGDYGKYVKLGQRIGLAYIRGIDDENTFEEFANMSDQEMKEFCDGLRRFCYGYEVSKFKQKDYWNFKDTGVFVNDEPFIVISVDTDTI